MNTSQFSQQLTGLIKGLYYMSESDYPFEILNWGSIEKNELRKHISNIKDYGDMIENLSSNDFFNKIISNLKASGDESSIAMAKQYEKLFDVINRKTNQLKVWRCGRIEVDIYITMELQCGETLALKTVSIET